MSVRTAVVLAAGEGTRLRPLTRNRPKPMLPAANRPILEHVFDALLDAGISRIVVVVGYKRGRVQNHFGPAYGGATIEYVRQDKQLGSGHALLQARETVRDPMLVVNGDRVIDGGSVRAIVDAHGADPGTPTMAVLERPDVSQYGAVELREDGDVAVLEEKPESEDYHLINGGIYAFPPAIFEAIEDTPRTAGELGLTETIARLADADHVRGVPTEGLWVDATYPWDLLAVAREVLARGRVDEPELDDRVWVDETAIVHDAATLDPPVVVDADCEIGPGAVVGPDTALGRNVTVSANATVTDSVLDADTRVDPGSTLIDTVTGQDVDLGAKTVVPGGPGDVRVGREVFENQPLGAVLADRVTARGNVSLSAGTLVGPNATLHAGAHVRDFVAGGSEVVR
jgi:glucose-1-phosphate thymidylyltransferase